MLLTWTWPRAYLYKEKRKFNKTKVNREKPKEKKNEKPKEKKNEKPKEKKNEKSKEK